MFALPQLSFAATTDPALAACNKQMDAESTTFFQQQATERDAFKKANPDIIAKLDAYGGAMMVYKNNISHHLPATAPTPYTNSVYTAFMGKQQGDKDTFLAKLAQDKQKCLGSAAL